MSTTSILKKVVFIDDDPSTNAFHKALTSSMNLANEVECFETAEEALKKYNNPNSNLAFPKIFFVDIGLPKMDGHELSVELRKLPGFQENQSAICFLTASKDIRDLIQADNNQFDFYYWKPLDERKIRQFLREAFGMFQD